jgi:hypothetical protein
MLQERDEATRRARRYRFRKQREKKKIYLLPETNEEQIVQVEKGRNWYTTSSTRSPFQKPRKKYFLGPHFFTQKLL